MDNTNNNNKNDNRSSSSTSSTASTSTSTAFLDNDNSKTSKVALPKTTSPLPIPNNNITPTMQQPSDTNGANAQLPPTGAAQVSTATTTKTEIVTNGTNGTNQTTWKLVDMWDEYNEVLLESFYKELLLPNYKNDLDPLEFWMVALSQEGRDNAQIGELHVLLALRDENTDVNQFVGPMSPKPTLDGGIMFLYYPDINCGLFIYMIIHQYRKNSDKGLDSLLINTAISILEKNAIQHGHLAGCNAIFLETDPQGATTTNTFSNIISPPLITQQHVTFHTSANLDLLDPRHQHAILHSLGFRLVDCDYMLRRKGSRQSRLLTVYLTSKIPAVPFEEGDKYYIPSRLVRMFVERHYWSLFEIGRVLDPSKKAITATKTAPPIANASLKSDDHPPKNRSGSNTPSASATGIDGTPPLRPTKIEKRKSSDRLVNSPIFSGTSPAPPQFRRWRSSSLGSSQDALAWRLGESAISSSSNVNSTSNTNMSSSKEISRTQTHPSNNPTTTTTTDPSLTTVTEMDAEEREMLAATELLVEQIEIRDKIPLLDLPWGGGRLYTLVDLFEDYDEGMLLRFYKELMEPNFAKDEIEPLENFINGLSAHGRSNPYYPDLHVLLALKWNQPYSPETSPTIIGGLVFEYHPAQNCGLITYFLIKPASSNLLLGTQMNNNSSSNVFANIPGMMMPPNMAPMTPSSSFFASGNAPNVSVPGSPNPRNATTQKQEDITTILIEEALAILDYNAKSRGNLAGCNIILLEAFSPAVLSRSNSRKASVGGELGMQHLLSYRKHRAVDVTQEHDLLCMLGFRLLNFQYVMPPFSSDMKKSNKFMLTVYLPPLLTASIPYKSDRYYLPSQALKTFVRGQWMNAYHQGHLLKEPNTDIDFKRMMKQLNIRQLIGCLELPWTSGTYTFLDIWNDYDEELLVKFYEELMVPSYADSKEELEPLENWIRALQTETKDDPNLLDLHVLLAIKWPTSDSEGQTAVIDGGCVFEYYRDINCGLLSYLVVKPKRSETLFSLLVEQVIDILNDNARSWGHMSGCNCVFWEANIQDFSNTLRKRNVSRPMAHHEFAHKMGFRQLDLTYVVPPVSPLYPQKLSNYVLTVLLNPNIPRMAFEEGYQYAVPSNVVAEFIRTIWKSAHATGRISYTPESDMDYVRSIEQIQVRQMIPLLDLPWSVKSWTFVDLWEDYDEDLLTNFYHHLMVPNFPIKDELEPLDLWLKLLSPSWRESTEADNDIKTLSVPEIHVILAIKFEGEVPFIGGGIVAEYYSTTNCGILTYLVVHKRTRGQGLASKLVSRAVDALDKNAKKRGKLAGCNAVFLETNSAEKVTPQQDVMDPRMRHTIYHKMGFRLIDFQYVMPPLAPGRNKLKILLLTVFLTHNIPRDPFRPNKYYIPNQLLQNFIHGQWAGASAKGNLEAPPEDDPDYVRSVQLLEMREKTPLLDLPWTRGKPFTIIDMWEDLDEELVSHFYENFMVPRFQHTGLEPLENWLKALSDEGRSDETICDLHVLLAFDLNTEDESNDLSPSTLMMPLVNYGQMSNMVGGLVFEYYPATNCALITYICVQGTEQYRGQLAKYLVQKAVRICDANAKYAGHIAGCNAIFLETEFEQVGDDNLNVSDELASSGRFFNASGPTPTPLELSTAVERLGGNLSALSIERKGLPARVDQLREAESNFAHQGPMSASTSSVPATPSLPAPLTKFSDPLDHTFLYQRGFRMLDFKYFQPPYNAANPTSRNVCLTVYITDRIPKYEATGDGTPTGTGNVSFETAGGEVDVAATASVNEASEVKSSTEPLKRVPSSSNLDVTTSADISMDMDTTNDIEEHAEQHFVPVALMRNFLANLWAGECSLINYMNYETDMNYIEMMEDLDILEERGGHVWVIDDEEESQEMISRKNLSFSQSAFMSMGDVLRGMDGSQTPLDTVVEGVALTKDVVSTISTKKRISVVETSKKETEDGSGNGVDGGVEDITTSSSSKEANDNSALPMRILPPQLAKAATGNVLLGSTGRVNGKKRPEDVKWTKKRVTDV